MTNHRMKRLLALLATLAACTVFAVGCGDDDDGGGGGDGGGNAPAIGGDTSGGGDTGGGADATPDNKDEAIDKCYEDAKKLEGQDRETAEAACEAADTGDTDKLKDEAKQQCLDAAEQVPDEVAREQAKDNCERITE